jgi:hypothetical protein
MERIDARGLGDDPSGEVRLRERRGLRRGLEQLHVARCASKVARTMDGALAISTTSGSLTRTMNAPPRMAAKKRSEGVRNSLSCTPPKIEVST